MEEDSKNPLRFAKKRKEKKLEIEVELENLKNINLTDLKKKLTSRGYSDIGDRATLAARFRRLRERDLKVGVFGLMFDLI